MKRNLLVAVVLLTGAACADRTNDTANVFAEQGAKPSREVTFVAGQAIPLTLTMKRTAEGGRTTPFFSGYRPVLEFAAGAQSTACAIEVPSGEFAPGTTHDVTAQCDQPVTVRADVLAFTLVQGGQPLGTGLVRL